MHVYSVTLTILPCFLNKVYRKVYISNGVNCISTHGGQQTSVNKLMSQPNTTTLVLSSDKILLLKYFPVFTRNVDKVTPLWPSLPTRTEGVCQAPKNHPGILISGMKWFFQNISYFSGQM